MIELTRTKMITAAILTMIGIIILGLITMTSPKYFFRSDPSLMISHLKKGDYQLTPGDMARKIVQKNKDFVLVDIRSQYEYAKGNIDGSINIPASDILDDENYSMFKGFQKDSKIVCLYGKDITEANVPFMTLHGLGFENISVLQGGYDYIRNKDINTVASENIVFNDESPLADIQKYIKEENVRSEKLAKQKIDVPNNVSQSKVKKSIQPEAKKSAPVKPAAVEEEGC